MRLLLKFRWLLFFIILLSNSAKADGMYYPQLIAFFKCDLVVDVSFKSSNKSFFWVEINEVVKDNKYGLKKGERLRIENVLNGDCGFEYDVSQNHRMRLNLVNDNHNWKLYLNTTASISIVDKGKSRLIMSKKTFVEESNVLNAYLKELYSFYRLKLNSDCFEIKGDLEELKQKMVSNPMIAQLESQNRCDGETASSAGHVFVESENEKQNILNCSLVTSGGEFVGGTKKLIAFVDSVLIYPPLLKEYQIEGKVYVEVYVSEHGKVHFERLLRKLHPLADKEAKRIALEMPDWEFPIHNNRRVGCKAVFPVRFQLDKK